jgi:hypothetical protein
MKNKTKDTIEKILKDIYDKVKIKDILTNNLIEDKEESKEDKFDKKVRDIFLESLKEVIEDEEESKQWRV